MKHEAFPAEGAVSLSGETLAAGVTNNRIFLPVSDSSGPWSQEREVWQACSSHNLSAE